MNNPFWNFLHATHYKFKIGTWACWTLLVMFKTSCVEWFKCNKDNCDIVHCFLSHWGFKYLVYCSSTLLMNIAGSIFKNTFPNALSDLCWGAFVKDTIACKKNKVHFLCDLELSYFWICNDYSFISSILL